MLRPQPGLATRAPLRKRLGVASTVTRQPRTGKRARLVVCAQQQDNKPSGSSKADAPQDVGDWVVSFFDEITRGAGDAIKLRPLALRGPGAPSWSRPEDAVAAVLEQAERLLAVLRALLTSGDAATSAAMQQRVLQPLATAVGGLRAALRGETGLLFAVRDFQSRVAAAASELAAIAQKEGASEDVQSALTELQAFGGLVGQLLVLLFGGGSGGAAAGDGDTPAATGGALKFTSSLGFSAGTPEEAVASLVVKAEQLLEALRRLLMADASTATEMKLRVLQPLQASINALKAAQADGGAGAKVALFELRDRVSATLAEVSRVAAGSGTTDDAKVVLAELQAFVSGLAQIISLFFGASASADGGRSLQRSDSTSASPALKMVASLDLSRATAGQAGKALVVLAEEFLEVARRLLLQDASTATAMKQRVLQPLQASINNLKAAASVKGGGAAGLKAAAPELQACLAAAKNEMLRLQKGEGSSTELSREISAATAQLDEWEASAVTMIKAITDGPSAAQAAAQAGVAAAGQQLGDLQLQGASAQQMVDAMEKLTVQAASMTAKDSAAADKAMASLSAAGSSAGAKRAPPRSDSPLEVAAGFLNRLLAASEGGSSGSSAASSKASAAASDGAAKVADAAASVAAGVDKAKDSAAAAAGEAADSAAAALSGAAGRVGAAADQTAAAAADKAAAAAAGISAAASAASGDAAASAPAAQRSSSPLEGLFGGLFGGGDSGASASSSGSTSAQDAGAPDFEQLLQLTAKDLAAMPAEEAMDAMVARAERVGAAMKASLGKADATAATVLEERVLEPLEDSIVRIKQAFRQEDAPDVEELMLEFQARLDDVGDELAQLSASGKGSFAPELVCSFKDLQGVVTATAQSAASAAGEAGGSAGAAAGSAFPEPPAVQSSSGPLGGFLGGLFGGGSSTSAQPAGASGLAAAGGSGGSTRGAVAQLVAQEELVMMSPDEAMDAMVARAEAVAAAVNASLGKADSRAAAVLEERVLEPLQDSIMRIKQAYRQEDAPDVGALLVEFQARLEDVGDEVAQLSASGKGSIGPEVVSSFRDLRGASESLISTFADLINSSGSFDRAAAEAVVGEAADKVSAAIGAKTGSAGQAVSAAACGMAAQAQAIAAEVSELAQATPDKAVNALVARAEAAAEKVRKGVSVAAGKDPAAAKQLEAQLVKPLQDQVAALKSAAADTSKASDLNKLLPNLQATLKQASGEVSKMAASKGGEVAAVADSLADELNSLTATADAAAQSVNNSLAQATPDKAVDALLSRAESAAASVRKAAAAAAGKDPAAAKQLEAQLLKPLQDQITALQGAKGKGAAGAAVVAGLVQGLTSQLAAVAADVGKIGSSDADVSAALRGLSSQVDSLSATAGAASASLQRATNSAVSDLLGRAEAIAASIQQSLSAAAGKDPAVSAKMEAQLLKPLQGKIAALKAAQANGATSAADLGAVLAELQQGVQSMGGELAKMAASSSTPDLAASIQGLTAELEALSKAASSVRASLPSGALVDADTAVAAGRGAGWLLQSLLGVGAMQAAKAGADTAMANVGVVAVPSAVVSMVGVTALLMLMGQKNADSLVAVHDSVIAPWTHDLLGLWFVPAVAIVPVLLKGMQAADLRGLLGVSAGCTALTLLITAKAASMLLGGGNTQGGAAGGGPDSGAAQPQSVVGGPAGPALLSLSALAAVVPLALTRNDPLGVGAAMALPVGVAWSVLGYLGGRVLFKPREGSGSGSGWLSPVLLGALAANAGVAWHASMMGVDWLTAMGGYYAGEAFGAGEVLAAPLGAALTSLGFLIYKHRAQLSLPAIIGTSVLSAALSVATAAGSVKILAVNAEWARAMVPRSVTSSVAVDMARCLGAPTECAGLAVLLQAAVAVAVGKLLLSIAYGSRLEPAAEGVAAGTTAGALGVAGIAGGTPAALAAGGLAYAVMAAVSGALVRVPQVAAALSKVVGA